MNVYYLWKNKHGVSQGIVKGCLHENMEAGLKIQIPNSHTIPI